MTTETRYRDLLNAIVSGPYYDPQGNVLPFKDSPTQLRILTSFLNEQFLISINGVFNGFVTTSSNGNAIFDIQLPLGELVLILQKQNSISKIVSYLSVRETAVWHAALAEQYEVIDNSIDSTLNSFYLAEAGSTDIDLAHGVVLQYPNETVAELEAYREMLQLIRQSTRQFTGRMSGKFGVISALTQINPLIIDRTKTGPRWILGYDHLFDGLQNSSRFPSGVLTSINQNGQFVTLVTVDNYANAGSGLLSYYTKIKRFRWTPPYDSTLGIINGLEDTLFYETPNASNDGQIIIPAGRSRANISSNHFPLKIINGSEEHLFLELDDYGVVVDVNLSLNGVFDGTGNLSPDKIINGFFRSRAPYNTKRRYSQPSTLLSPYLEVISVRDYTAIGGASLNTDGSSDLAYTAPNDSQGPFITPILNDVNTLISGDGVSTVDIFMGVTVLPISSLHGFTIFERYSNPASLKDSNTQLVISSQNKTTVDGPSSVTIHDGYSIGGFGVPNIDISLAAPVNPTDTSISIINTIIDRFSLVKGENKFPFNIVIGRGSRGKETSFTVTANNPSITAILTTTSPIFDPSDTHVNIIIDSTGSGSRNIGVHKIIAFNNSQSVDLVYGGIGAPQPDISGSGVSGVSVIGVTQRVSGSSTLYFTFATTDLSWSAPGDSVGSTVTVSDGYFRLYSNNGVDYLDILVDSSLLPGGDINETLFISAFETITASGGDQIQVWSNGEKATVIGVTSGTPDIWHLAAPIVGKYTTSHRVYLQNIQLPYKVYGEDAYGELTLDIDASEEPSLVTPSDTLDVLGSDLPNGWLNLSTGTSIFKLTPDSKYRRGALLCSNTGADLILKRDLDFSKNLRGLVFTLKVLVRNGASAASLPITIGIGFDFGSGVTYTNTIIDDVDDTLYAPRLLELSQIIPFDAAQFTIKINRTLAGGAEDFFIDRVIVFQSNTHGIFLGNNTIPRNKSRANFGSLMYIWSPDELSNDELTLLGINNSLLLEGNTYNGNAPVEGRISEVVNAHEEVDVIDITDMVSNDVVNVRGSVTDLDWNLDTLTNIEVIARVPRRLSYIKPLIINFQDETVSFSTVTFKAALSEESDQNQNTALLFEDEVPVPQDEWQFNSAIEIEIVSGFNASAIYRFEYQALIRVETQPIDLLVPDNNSNDTWFADYVVWNRHDTIAGVLRDDITLNFNNNLSATLIRRSDADKLQSVLTENTGITTRIVPQQNWNYIDSLNVRISGAEFNTNSIYTLTYNQQIPTINRVATILAEIRGASTIFSLSSAVYAEFNNFTTTAINSSLRYHQIRLTVSNVGDLRDVRIHSAVLKGLRLSTSPIAPGL